MAGGRTEYELLVTAHVKDEATKQLKAVEQAVKNTKKATGDSTKATDESNKAVAIMNRQLVSLASRFTPVILGTLAFNRALGLVAQAQRAVAEEAGRMILAAKDAQESQGALSAVFGEFAAEQEKAIEKLAALAGRATTEVRKAQVELGTSLQALGIDGQAGADAVKILSERVLDMAAALDQPDPGIFFDKMAAGIAGSEKAFRALGVQVSDSTLKQEAFNRGMGDGKRDLTQTEQAVTRLALALEQTEKHQGEANEQLGEFEGLLHQINKTIADTRSRLGKELITDAENLVTAFGGIDNVLLTINVTLEVVAVTAKATMATIAGAVALAEQLAPFLAATIPGGSLGLAEFKELVAEVKTETLMAKATSLGVSPDILKQIEDKIKLAQLDELTFGDRHGLPGEPAAQKGLSSLEANKAAHAGLEALIAEAMKSGAKKGSTEVESVFQSLLESLRQMIERQNESLVTAKDLRPQMEFIVQLRDTELGIELQLAETVQQKERLLKIISTREQNSLEQKAEELGLLESQRYQLETIEALRVKLVERQVEELRLAEERKRAEAELEAFMRQHAQNLEIVRGAAGDLAAAFVDAAHGADDAFRRAFDNILSNILRIQIQAMLLQGAFGFLTGPLGMNPAGVAQGLGLPIPSAKGNVFSGGDVVPFAGGGLINSPIAFPLRGGRMGVAGERGPEAILPLERGAGGRLGVVAQGGGGGLVISPGAITVHAAPGQSPESVALAVLAALQTNPAFIQAIAGAGGVVN